MKSIDTQRQLTHENRTGLKAWCISDTGSATVEATLIAPFLVLLLVFVAVFIHRGVDTRLRLNDAAHQAARAASIERTDHAAKKSAHTVAQNYLTSIGHPCTQLIIETATSSAAAGAMVTVTILCEVDVSDSLLLGIPHHPTLSATATEPVDIYRAKA